MKFLHISKNFLSSSARYDTKTLGSWLSNRLLGNFQLVSEGKKTAHLTQNAVDKRLPLPFLYGGDIMGNMVLAAAHFLPAQNIMSLGIEYISPGAPATSRNYFVEKVRQSGRFTHIMVTIKQDTNRTVAVGNLAYHSLEGSDSSLSYTPPFPDNCPLPCDLTDDDVLLKQYEKDSTFKSEDLAYARRTVDMIREFGSVARPCHPDVYFRLTKEATTCLSFWMRYPESEMEHVFPDIKKTTWSPALLAFASDFRIMGPALRQNPSFRDGKMTTLSHHMWFSPYVEMKSPTEWFLYHTQVLMSANNIILCEGQMWNEKKQLLAITKQQGLCRPKHQQQKGLLVSHNFTE